MAAALRDIESALPPGFRFHPSDRELVCHYLRKKVAHDKHPSSPGGTMVEVDLHTQEPWELPDEAKVGADEWYFFSFKDRKYATGQRANRATKSGYWKATGKDRVIYNDHGKGRRAVVAGMRKTLVFYHGRAPNGIKSCWVMHEFRLENPTFPPKEDWVLCRVFHKKNPSQGDYGRHDHDENDNIDGNSFCREVAEHRQPSLDDLLLLCHHDIHYSRRTSSVLLDVANLGSMTTFQQQQHYFPDQMIEDTSATTTTTTTAGFNFDGSGLLLGMEAEELQYADYFLSAASF